MIIGASIVTNVFISHRSADTAIAEKLARSIERAGHLVWFDLWDINLGDSIVGRMNEGLMGATYVIVCYSAAGIDTPWMGREWMSTLARQLNGRGVKLLPVLLAGAAAPAILEDIKYADLSTDWDRGLAQLLRAIV